MQIAELSKCITRLIEPCFSTEAFYNVVGVAFDYERSINESFIVVHCGLNYLKSILCNECELTSGA
jgi:hypothetical protein